MVTATTAYRRRAFGTAPSSRKRHCPAYIALGSASARLHLIDVLLGRSTERVVQLGHDKLSVFGIGTELDERRWRAVLRQLVALGHLQPDGEAFGALKLTPSARGVLKGESQVMLREETTAGSPRKRGNKAKTVRSSVAPTPVRPAPLPYLIGTTRMGSKPYQRPAQLALRHGSQAGRARLRRLP